MYRHRGISCIAQASFLLQHFEVSFAFSLKLDVLLHLSIVLQRVAINIRHALLLDMLPLEFPLVKRKCFPRRTANHRRCLIKLIIVSGPGLSRYMRQLPLASVHLILADALIPHSRGRPARYAAHRPNMITLKQSRNAKRLHLRLNQTVTSIHPFLLGKSELCFHCLLVCFRPRLTGEIWRTEASKLSSRPVLARSRHRRDGCWVHGSLRNIYGSRWD